MPQVLVPDPERTGSYLICATPRTGSSLLCGLLDSTEVAGHPESWFRRQGEQEFAARWGIADPSDGTLGYVDYFRAAVAAGSTANGVFAARIMWGTMDEVIRIARGVLGFLGLDLPAGREITIRHQRLADELNARWIENYHRYESGCGA